MAAEKNQFMFYLELLKKSEFPISFHGEILRGQNAKDMIKILTLSLNNIIKNGFLKRGIGFHVV